MRHRKSGRHLTRTSSHRNAMFRNMAVSLFRHELIKTNTDNESFPLQPCPRNSIVQVTFSLVLPHLRTGSYAISVGFGNGTLDQHCAYDWIENISVFSVECPEQCYGLLKAPVEVTQKFIENDG